MKKIIGVTFEPLWFVYGAIVLGIMALFPTRRAHLMQAFRKHPTGRSLVVILRLVSKRVSQDMPFVMPSILMLGGVMGGLWSGASGALLGCGAAYLLMIALPILLPMPSVQMELAEIAHQHAR